MTFEGLSMKPRLADEINTSPSLVLRAGMGAVANETRIVSEQTHKLAHNTNEGQKDIA